MFAFVPREKIARGFCTEILSTERIVATGILRREIEREKERGDVTFRGKSMSNFRGFFIEKEEEEEEETVTRLEKIS